MCRAPYATNNEDNLVSQSDDDNIFLHMFDVEEDVDFDAEYVRQLEQDDFEHRMQEFNEGIVRISEDVDGLPISNETYMNIVNAHLSYVQSVLNARNQSHSAIDVRSLTPFRELENVEYFDQESSTPSTWAILECDEGTLEEWEQEQSPAQTSNINSLDDHNSSDSFNLAEESIQNHDDKEANNVRNKIIPIPFRAVRNRAGRFRIRRRCFMRERKYRRRVAKRLKRITRCLHETTKFLQRIKRFVLESAQIVDIIEE